MITPRCLIEGLIPGVRFEVPSWTRNNGFVRTAALFRAGATMTSLHVMEMEIDGLAIGNCEPALTGHSSKLMKVR